MAGVDLVLSYERVARFSPPRMRKPSVAVVYAADNGELYLIEDGKPMRWSDAITSRFRYRYEIDLSDHRRQVVLQSQPPVAAGGVYRFEASLNVGFRVVDPREIVRRNIQDALPVIHTHLTFVCREIASGFEIEDARQVEEAINSRFRLGERLPEGIDIFMVQAHIIADAQARQYLDAKVRAERDGDLKGVQHRVSVDDAMRENQLELIRQSGDLERRRREYEAVAGRPLTAEELIRLHLTQHPEDTDRAMELLSQAHQAAFTREDERLKNDRAMLSFLADRGLLRPPDIAELRDRAVTGVSAPAIQVPPATVGPPAQPTGSWDDPLPKPPAASVGPGPADPGVIPVYIVLDESLTGNIPDLETAIRSLYEALVDQPEIARVVRLSVLGVADDVDIVRALEAVDRQAEPPGLRAGGPARYSRAFEQLLHCIPRDTAALKARHSSVRRPQVIVLTGSPLGDDQSWLDVHRQLIDRDAHRSAPDIVAVGVGGAEPDTVARMATRPDFAYVATTPDVAMAIQKFSDFVRAHVLRYGRAVIDGDASTYTPTPDGFRPAVP